MQRAHGRRRGIGDAEVAREIGPVAQRLGKLAEPGTKEFKQAGTAQPRPFLARGENLYVRQFEHQRFDAVVGGEEPARHRGAPLRVARQQRGVLFGEMEQDRAAFEQADIAVAQHRHLPPRLVAIMIGRPVDRADQPLGIIDAHFLARPARTQVADEALREIGNPVESGDFDRRIGFDAHGPTPFCP